MIISKPVLILVGPTAIGKTDLSLDLAEKYQCEIISVDSMQVYRYMDIGTAKVTKQEQAKIPHHLIDVVYPDENYDAARFADDAITAINDIHHRDKIPLLTGGTGLYIKALIDGIFPDAPSDEKTRERLRLRLDQEGSSKLHEELALCDCVSAFKIHKNDTHRLLRALEVYHLTGIPWSQHLLQHQKYDHEKQFTNLLQIGLTTKREELYKRINLRSELMIKQGFEEEVRALLDKGYHRDLKSMNSIGYKHMVNYISGDWGKSEMQELLARDTRRYAKRQYTWFNRNESLKWIDVSDKKLVGHTIGEWLSSIQ